MQVLQEAADALRTPSSLPVAHLRAAASVYCMVLPSHRFLEV